MIFRTLFPFFIGAIFLFSGNINAQDIPIGTWRDHLPYSDAVSITKNGNIVYVATNSAIFIYDDKDKSIERLNLVNGLSDIGLSKIKYIPTNGRIVVAYQNGNIDVIDENNQIINLSFIKNSNTVGNKKINHIYVENELAYLSTGVGIVVLNTNKLEFVDTYNFEPNGNSSFTNAITIDSLNIYAASDQGVFFAPKNSANLADFNSWSQVTALGNFPYNSIVKYDTLLFVGFDSPNFLSDSVFYNPGGVWQNFSVDPSGINIDGLSISSDKLLVEAGVMYVYDQTLTQVEAMFTYKGQFNLNAAEGLIADGYYWIADKSNGLIKAVDNFTSEKIVPNGPSSINTFNIDFVGDELWEVSGGYNIFLANNMMNHRSQGSWSSLPAGMVDGFGNTAFDMVSVAINPSNSSNVFIGSWTSGLYEFNNETVTNIYNAQNSVLDSTFFGSTAVGALSFDNDNNLWVSNSFSANALSVKTPDNTWYNYNFTGLATASHDYTTLIIDDNNYKWVGTRGGKSILVFNDNGTLNITNDDQKILLTPSINDIPGAKLESMVKDLDGQIWIGTDEGVAVFYSPSNVFDQTIKAEQIFIQQDGQTQILLEREVVSAIAVDGANRKWLGTQNSGVFLMSADGTEEIEHFTSENSPLFSNSVFSIVIDPKTGEVYFGTSKGLISYKGTATEAQKNFDNIFVYPNPVKEDFRGTIAIRGLVANTDVRITDVSGNIVYKTTSLGGQAIWDGNDMNGNRVQTGVYLIFNGTQDGQLKKATKILFIH